MDFVSNQALQFQEMLAAIGVKDIQELFRAIPPELMQPSPAEDDGLSEYEGMQLMEKLAQKNMYDRLDNYLGAGAYEHHVPALVGAICSKSEFLTSYTPYQAEASQGMLQCIFEFQSAICALTGMDVANASLYDGSSACAESVLMALRYHKDRKKVLIAQSLHPQYRGVVDQYLNHIGAKVETIPFLQDGTFDEEALEQLLDHETAGVLISYPNFFGQVEEVSRLTKKIQDVGALSIVCANPLVYGLYRSAAELGADIAIGDCQPFGISLQFGGPYAGYIACKESLVRQLPGRIVGETQDDQGNRGFVLTLQTREQHIRREKATSNICTNQALTALASLVAILWYGKEGIRKLALTNYQRAVYLKEKLQRLGISSGFGHIPLFNEFVVVFPRPADVVQSHFRKHGIEPGVDLGRFYSQFKNHFLIAVTETKSKIQLDYYCAIAKKMFV